MSEYDVDPEVYWQEDARAERDERDLDQRHVEDDERDRLTRDVGENPRQISDYGVLEGWYDRPFPWGPKGRPA